MPAQIRPPRAPPPPAAHLADAHLAQRVAHGIDRVPHFVGPDGADASDAEGLDFRQLPGYRMKPLSRTRA
jgi:hypothetical protein